MKLRLLAKRYYARVSRSPGNEGPKAQKRFGCMPLLWRSRLFYKKMQVPALKMLQAWKFLMKMSGNLPEYSEYANWFIIEMCNYKFNGSNLDSAQISNEAQNSEVGKEAGQKVRDRARQKKFYVKSEATKEELPLRLAVETNGKIRHYCASEKIYNFIPVPDRKTMDIEEVEEHFKRREVVLIQFALRTRILRMEKGNLSNPADGNAQHIEASNIFPDQASIAQNEMVETETADGERASDKKINMEPDEGHQNLHRSNRVRKPSPLPDRLSF
ncbi:hypothetical protein T11_16936 [Trichinella zimbabwensis]|uniref:Uncharacterized protein n=1 Tax=Trichinella zimbabwensis TaxID=268475 RepID=A0A0V1HPB9_9BILA|nr:hypothetical protein T11_16936 [Trichinella zimbabwensis]